MWYAGKMTRFGPGKSHDSGPWRGPHPVLTRSFLATMTTPLPPLGNLFQGVKAVRMAYERILPLENESEHPILIRILGWMLIHAPNDAGRTNLARDINQCLHNAPIFDLGRRYFHYFIKYFRTVANKPTPTPSDHSSHPSMDTVQDSILATLQQ
ncbi:unnamed protein product, partial [Rhizoctonia solani]